ncbi:hypothetical protein WME96_36660 [Sorangium sp. So ce406]
MPTLEHNALVEMFREDPELAPRLLATLLHVEVPPHAAVAVVESSLDQPIPVEFRADLVLDLRDENDALVLAMVIEVQRDVDPDKKFSGLGAYAAKRGTITHAWPSSSRESQRRPLDEAIPRVLPSGDLVLRDDIQDPGDAEAILEHPVEGRPSRRRQRLRDGRAKRELLPELGDLLGRVAADRDKERVLASLPWHAGRCDDGLARRDGGHSPV